MVQVIAFTDPQATQTELVGGKAANLGLLTNAGFDVPPGFVVTTEAYSALLDAAHLGKAIDAVVTELDFDDVDRLDAQAAEIRALILDAPMPDDLVEAIRRGYDGLGGSAFVAVRSSGTAEDTAAASFAGLHDTYLDIRGGDAVVDAVRRCWASMWSARATAYRQVNAVDQGEVRIAVVVQRMVESEVSGVMFTANPLTSRSDEIVINASWGLGEAIVSGLATPDEYTLDLGTLAVRRRTVGAKEVQVIRDAGVGSGTVTEANPAPRRDRLTLDDTQAGELAQLGRRVQEHYDGLPQDIEWGYAEGRFYLLQARPVTGVDLTWDEDLEEWQDAGEGEDTVWSVKWADEFWTGAITPLFYTVRGREFLNIIRRFNTLCGFDELNDLRYFKYRRGTAYYNVNVDKTFFNSVLPPSMRAGSLGYLPESWRAEVLAQPLQIGRFLKMLARVSLLTPHKRPDRWHRYLRTRFIESRVKDADGPDPEQLRGYSDLEVRRQLQRSVALAEDFMDQLWSGLFIPTQWAMGLLGQMLAKWYTGGNAFAFPDLISGLGRPTLMSTETHDLWRLAERIRSSASLSGAFREHEGAVFFSAVEHLEDGPEFLTEYRRFLHDHGHRGHADRDFYFPRRVEDPSLDYEAFRALLSTEDPVPPWESEAKIAVRRQETEDAVIENLRRGTFGSAKAEAFKIVYGHVLDFLVLRDDWRHYIDRVSLAKKRCFLELARRAVERGLLDSTDDCFFLGEQEFTRLLDTGRRTPLLQRKITARRDAFQAFLTHREAPPTYLIGAAPAELDAAGEDRADGVLRGAGTARGVATGVARIVPELAQIGSVRKGDILVCNGTDPGWAPVFPLISGLVIEAGGMLAHGSCLSREYGIPAIQLRSAMQLIEPGQTIEINGATGEIRVADTARAESTA